MKQLVDLQGALGYRLPIRNFLGANDPSTRAKCSALFPEPPIERLYQAFRYYMSAIESARPPSLSYLRDGLQQGGGK